MRGTPVNIRQIVEDHRFKIELAEIIKDARRADEFMDGALWALSHSPEECGGRIGDSPVWYLQMRNAPNLIPVVLYYAFNDNEVFLLSIIESQYPVQK